MKLLKNKYGLLLMLLLAAGATTSAQDSVARELILNLSYYMPVDNIPYLKVTAKEKVERKFIPQKDIAVTVYMGEESDAGLLGKIKTNGKGEAIVYFPSTFKPAWDSSASFSFSVVTEPNKIFESTKTEIQVTKSRIEIDTATEDETKNVMVKVTELKNGGWLPAADVELKIAVKRSLGNLPVGDEETYTTDSTGMVTAEFKRDSLPGDAKGNLTLIARTEDNELYGNIFSEKLVNWGQAPKIDSTFFNKRSLWATRFRTPVWLLVLAYGIIGAVWGTLIYLIVQLFRIRKLGKVAK